MNKERTGVTANKEATESRVPLRLVKLKSSLRKFYGRPHDLVDRYGIFASQMTTNMIYLSLALPCPFLIHDLSPGQNCTKIVMTSLFQ
jgi:hypothetical protein